MPVFSMSIGKSESATIIVSRGGKANPGPQARAKKPPMVRGVNAERALLNTLFVFIDENEKSIQQSAFGINAPDHWWLFGTGLWTWISFPTTRHNNGGTFTFADGHAENWHWLEQNTARISSMNAWIVLQSAVRDSDRDLSRLFRAVPEKVPLL